MLWRIIYKSITDFGGCAILLIFAISATSERPLWLCAIASRLIPTRFMNNIMSYSTLWYIHPTTPGCCSGPGRIVYQMWRHVLDDVTRHQTVKYFRQTLYRIFYRLRRRPCRRMRIPLCDRWKRENKIKVITIAIRNIVVYSKLYCSFSSSHFTAHKLHATNSCAKLSDKPAEITEIRHTTFWNNILPLTSHSSGWRHPVGQRFALRMRHGILFRNISYPNSPQYLRASGDARRPSRLSGISRPSAPCTRRWTFTNDHRLNWQSGQSRCDMTTRR